jgi:hypothetical protein
MWWATNQYDHIEVLSDCQANCGLEQWINVVQSN